MKQILLYEKSKNGHRGYIGNEIIKNNKCKNIKYYLIQNEKKKNCLEVILKYNRYKKIKHYHLLTLDDCIFDFNNKKLVNEIIKNNITITATLFYFDLLQTRLYLKNVRKKIREKYPETVIISKLLKENIIKKIFIPDERINNFFLYPLFRKQIFFLPDFTRFKSKVINKKEACKKLGIDKNRIVFLIFGKMDKYKGLEFLIKTIESGKINNNRKITIIIAGENKGVINLNQDSLNIDIVEFNKYIDNNYASLLFSACDCVLLPFVKSFKKSSGTFALACSFGKFIITTRGGILEWRIKKYKNGYVFKPENKNALASAINKFIEKYDNIKYPISGSIEYSKTCSIDNYLKILNNYFSEYEN